MNSVLHNDVGARPGRHHLAATPSTVRWGWLPAPGDEPVLVIDPGDTVTVDTLSHEGVMPAQGADPVAYFATHGVPADQVLRDAIVLAAEHRPVRPGIDGPHISVGPIQVRGTRPGDVLVVDFLELRPRVPYGLITARHGKGALPFEVPAVHGPDDPGTVSAFCRLEGQTLQLGSSQLRFPLAPMLGIVGVTPTGPRRHSVPPGAFGGNLDVRDLQVGSRLYLGVETDGAGCYFGDPHFAQGHGEVAITAVEASVRATVRIDVIPAARIPPPLRGLGNPIGETDTHWLVTGLGSDLDEALRSSTRAAVTMLGQVAAVDEAHALLYLSAAADFVVTQVVNEVKGIHCLIRKADFPGASPGPSLLSLAAGT
jgi:acetamidase/formamidase